MEGVPADSIEVGAIGGDLRFCRAKEALRQGEAALASQASVRSALETRATALTGWASVNLLAAAGGAFAAKTVPVTVGAICAGITLFVSAAIGIHAARPRDWTMVGYDPRIILDDRLGSELELVESIAFGISTGNRLNDIRLARMGAALRWSGWLLIASPGVGGAGYLAPAFLRTTMAAVGRLLIP